MGYYYRNEGLWKEADDAYEKAHHAIAVTLANRADRRGPRRDGVDPDELGLRQGTARCLSRGSEPRGERQHGPPAPRPTRETGISLSVCGEVYRYDAGSGRPGTRTRAPRGSSRSSGTGPGWALSTKNRPSACFRRAGPVSPGPRERSPPRRRRGLSRSRWISAVIERRGYPSALNRAGRIYGGDDRDRGLKHLRRGSSRPGDCPTDGSGSPASSNTWS